MPTGVRRPIEHWQRLRPQLFSRVSARLEDCFDCFSGAAQAPSVTTPLIAIDDSAILDVTFRSASI
jgi:hypothetical protein